jgi:ferredoxin--NADP+ reductase
VFPWLQKPAGAATQSKLSFRLLTSPIGIRPDEAGRIARLQVVENLLVMEGTTTKAKATDKTTDLDFDTLIFAIGDVADPSVGLPYQKGAYVTNPDAAEPDRAAYEVFDAQAGRVLEGHYVVGWARKASEGLVGKARYDAEHGCGHILKYLEGAAKKTTATEEEILRQLAAKGTCTVTKDDASLLVRAEEARARAANLPAFKFSTNEEMLAAIEAEKQAGR